MNDTDTITTPSTQEALSPKVIVLSGEGARWYGTDGGDSGSSIQDDAMLMAFLNHMRNKNADGRRRGKPVDIDETKFLSLPQERQLAIRQACRSYYEKKAWQAQVDRAHKAGVEMYNSANGGIKIMHFPKNNQTLAVAMGMIPGTGSGPGDEDWGVQISVAQARGGEPYCKRTGKAMALEAMANKRTIAINLSAMPGFAAAKEPSDLTPDSEGWTPLYLLPTEIACLANAVRTIFGNRRGDAPTKADRDRAARIEVSTKTAEARAKLKAARKAFNAAKMELEKQEARLSKASPAAPAA